MKLIIDGNNIVHGAYHRAKSNKLKDVHNIMVKFLEENPSIKKSDNIYKEEKAKHITVVHTWLTTFVVQIFFTMLHKLIRDNDTRQVFFLLDGRGGTKWRKEILPEYKGNRDRKSDEFIYHFYEAIEKIEDILDFYPLHKIKINNSEADDIMYTLAEKYNGEDVKIISSDGDMVQLIQKFEKVSVYNSISKKDVLDPGYDIVLYKAIAGDSSDNIDGIKGFGPKKTIKAMNEKLVNFSDEQKKEIHRFTKIIDLALNPNKEKNLEEVNNILQNDKIFLDHEAIKKKFFDLKIKSFITKWDPIKQMLGELERQYGPGDKKSKSD